MGGEDGPFLIPAVALGRNGGNVPETCGFGLWNFPPDRATLTRLWAPPFLSI